MSNNKIYIDDEIEVEDSCIFNSKTEFPIQNFKKDNIKNWSFKSKNSLNNDRIRNSDTNRISDYYSVNFTDSTEKREFIPNKQKINFSSYIKNNGDESSVGVFSLCEASVGNSNYINIPQNLNLKNNFISTKNNSNNNNYNKNKHENPVIDLTDSLSEIPEEIKLEQNSKSEIKPSIKMLKYLDNTLISDKMRDFSNKKSEYQNNFKSNNQNHIKTNNNHNSDENLNNKYVPLTEQKNSERFLKKASLNDDNDDIYEKDFNEFLKIKENYNEYENEAAKENKSSDVKKTANSLKFNNLDTQSYLNLLKKNSDNNLNNINNLDNNNNYQNKNSNEEILYNIIKTEENEEQIEEVSNLDDNAEKNQPQSKRNQQSENSTTNINNISSSKKTEAESQNNGIKILKTSNNFFIEGSKSDLKANDYIYDDSIRIKKYLSEGAQAKVYLGHIEEINKFVAIKRYSIIENDNDLISKINVECEFIKSLDHPNIIKYYDIDVNYRNNFTSIDLIMEFVEGKCLKDYVNSEDFVYLEKDEKEKMVKFMIRNILNGIDYLHSNKIIHRDLKPENILISTDLEDIKIVDFGISTKVKDSETLKNRSVLGTPWYMAPEVILERPYAFEADIWSVGCILYELISGVKPYNDNNPFNAMLKMAQYTSPLEYADDEIKDLFYDRANRNLLDFLQKCWRANNMFRPSAKDLLEHKYLN